MIVNVNKFLNEIMKADTGYTDYGLGFTVWPYTTSAREANLYGLLSQEENVESAIIALLADALYQGRTEALKKLKQEGLVAILTDPVRYLAGVLAKLTVLRSAAVGLEEAQKLIAAALRLFCFMYKGLAEDIESSHKAPVRWLQIVKIANQLAESAVECEDVDSLCDLCRRAVINALVIDWREALAKYKSSLENIAEILTKKVEEFKASFTGKESITIRNMLALCLTGIIGGWFDTTLPKEDSKMGQRIKNKGTDVIKIGQKIIAMTDEGEAAQYVDFDVPADIAEQVKSICDATTAFEANFSPFSQANVLVKGISEEDAKSGIPPSGVIEQAEGILAALVKVLDPMESKLKKCLDLLDGKDIEATAGSGAHALLPRPAAGLPRPAAGNGGYTMQ